MTTKQKAEAFDLIAGGCATGMPLVYKRFEEMQKIVREKGDGELLRTMGQLACEEAVTTVLGGSL